jgi:hypothetical protein
MDLSDKIETRRFVGREFLLFLWFESELLEGTFSTTQHGSFGFWLEKSIVLSAAKEVTQIKGVFPAQSREAKEALRRGKLPDQAGIHLAYRDSEYTCVFKAAQLAISGLSFGTALGESEEDNSPNPLLEAPRRPRAKAKAADLDHEAFYERMHNTQAFEEVLEALYQDFLTLRLGPAWQALVVPAMRKWAAAKEGHKLESEAYVEARTSALRQATKGAKRG